MVRVFVGIVLGACLASSSAYGQGVTIWGDVGRQHNELGNGDVAEGLAFGGGVSLIAGGSTGKKVSVLFPVNFELRSDSEWGNVDMLGAGDIAIRVGPFAFGPGANLGYIWRRNANDPRCPRVPPAGSSCLQGANVGTRDIGNFIGIGFSGFAKLNFGPQERAFIQGRYIKYHPDWMYFRSAAESLVAQGLDFEIPTDFPEFDGGRDIRLAAGYTFGSGTGVLKLLRFSYSNRHFDFTPTKANVTGVFDQVTRQFAVGFGISF